MKIAVVYYTMSGNTEYVANKIAENLGADLVKLVPKKAYHDTGFKKFFLGGKSAVMGEKPELEEYEFDARQYDHIIIGTPVWAATFVPPIRTFISENKLSLKSKKFSVFISYSGGGADKTIEKLKKELGIENFKNTLILIDPKDNRTEGKDKQIEEFCQKIKE